MAKRVSRRRRRVGRPSLPAALRRRNRSTSCTAAEWRTWGKRAKELGISTAAFLRVCANYCVEIGYSPRLGETGGK